MRQKINIKPLSVNEAWKGKRFKTAKYNKYERELYLLLRALKLPLAPFKVILKFGFSSKLSDIDNPIKMTLDIMQKKYKFNDRDIFELQVTKEIVIKGKEYLEIEFLNISLIEKK